MKIIVKDKSFYIKVALMAIPISLQSLISIGVNLMDTIMLGTLGEIPLSASSLANQFINIYFICCMGIAMGASVLTARFWGMKDIISLKKAITIMLRLCIVFAIFFTIPTITSPVFLMRLYTSESIVISQGVLYFKWMIPCYILMGLTLTCTIILRSVGQVKIPLIVTIISFFVNILGNYIFIFGKFGAPVMGIEGAALGTLIARTVECGLICGFFFTKDDRINYRIKDLTMQCKSLVKDYLVISIPVLVSDALLAFGNTAIAMIMGRIGSSFVSANSITTITQQLSSVLIQGICHAGCIITGHTLGEGDKKKALKQAYTFMVLGAVIGIFAAMVIMVSSDFVISFYNITEETKIITKQLMNAVAIIVVFQATNHIMTKGVLRGGGDTRFLMVADILFLWIVSVPFGAMAGLVWNTSAFWIYICLKLDQIIKAVWCVYRLKSGKWIKTIISKEQEGIS